MLRLAEATTVGKQQGSHLVAPMLRLTTVLGNFNTLERGDESKSLIL